MRYRIRKDQRLKLKGREYIVVEALTNGDVKLQDAQSNVCIAYPKDHLVQGICNGSVSLIDDNQSLVRKALQPNLSLDFTALPEEDRADAKRIFEYIKEILEQKMDRKVLKAYIPIIKVVADRIGDANPPSEATLYRRQRDFEASGGNIRSLVRVKGKGNTYIKVDSDIDKIIKDVIAELFMDKQRLNVPAVYAAVVARIEERNSLRDEKDKLLLPAQSTIYRRVKKLDPYEVTKARYGKRLADAKFGILKSLKPPTRPLERVEIDHTKSDLMVVDEIRALLIGRPWLTVAIDKYSRCNLGICLSFTPPSYVTVMKCLIHAIKTKEYVQKEYPDIKHAWDTYGLPEGIVVDNGKEFHSTHFEDACLQLQIAIQYAPPKIPWYKGSVERFFGSLNTELLHQQPGTTFSNYLDKGEYDPAKHAVIDLSLLRWKIHKWIVDVYHQDKHRGVNDKPSFLWNEGIKAYPPALPGSESELRVLLGKMAVKPITSVGITMFGLTYRDPALAILRRRHGNDRVRVKYDPMDLSMIYVYDTVDHIYIPVPADDQEYTQGLNEWQHKIIWQHARKQVDGRIDIVALAQAKEELRQVVRGYLATRKGDTTCQRVARYAGLDEEPYRVTTSEPAQKRPTEPDVEPALDSDLVQTGGDHALSGVANNSIGQNHDVKANATTPEETSSIKTPSSGNTKTKRKTASKKLQAKNSLRKDRAEIALNEPDGEEWKSNYDTMDEEEMNDEQAA